MDTHNIVINKACNTPLTPGQRAILDGIPKVKSAWEFLQGRERVGCPVAQGAEGQAPPAGCPVTAGETVGEEGWRQRQEPEEGEVPECASTADLAAHGVLVPERGSGGARVVGVVYVDEVVDYPEAAVAPRARRYGRRWCHLWCDPGPANEAELHRLARLVGCARGWFQGKRGFPHYDLVPSKRAAAIRQGAVPLSLREWLRRNQGGLR